MARYDIDFTEERFYALGGMPSEKIIQLLSDEHGIKGVDVDVAAEQKEAAFIDRIDQLKPKDDVCQIVRDHIGKLPLAVASGGPRHSVFLQLSAIGLRDVFDSIVGAEDTDRHKPEPDVFLKAAKQIGVEPTECLVYEDSPLGIQAAVAAGMDYIDVR